jgi:hypothetical protein
MPEPEHIQALEDPADKADALIEFLEAEASEVDAVEGDTGLPTGDPAEDAEEDPPVGTVIPMPDADGEIVPEPEAAPDV